MDLWGLNTHLARYILPMLRKFFKNPMGHPCDLKSVKEWQAIGDKMIWSLERHDKDDMFELAETKTGYHPTSKRIRYVDAKGKPAVKFVRATDDSDEALRKAWLAELKRLQEQEQEGMRLFGEYFGNLWD